MFLICNIAKLMILKNVSNWAEINPFCAKASWTSKLMRIRGTHKEHNDRKKTPGTDSKTGQSTLTIEGANDIVPTGSVPMMLTGTVLL